MNHTHSSQLPAALMVHFSSLLIFIQTYSFDLQRPPPPNHLHETTGTFEPVYLDDLVLGECGYINMFVT